MPPTEPSPDAAPRAALALRLRRIFVRIGLAASALTCLLTLIGLALAKERPAWWRTVRRDDPRSLQIADQLENGIVNALFSREHSPEPGAASQPWRVSLDAGDANAWLNSKMPRWLEAEFERPMDWPEELREVQVDFRSAAVRIGIRISETDQVFWASIEPTLDEQGRLWIPARWVYLGRLPMPASWVLERARRNPGGIVPDDFTALPETDAMFRMFAGEVPAFEEPVVKLSDGRRVRLLALNSLEDGRIIITCRTERPARAEASRSP